MEDQEPKNRGQRAKTMDCMARIVNAFLACGQMTVNELADKSGVGSITVRRSLKALITEGLVEEVEDVFQRPKFYRWTDKK